MTEPRGKGDAVSPENDGRRTRSLASQQSGPMHFSSSDAAGQVIRTRHAPTHRTTPAGGSGASRGMRLAGSADPGREDFGSRRGLAGGALNHEVSGTTATSRQSHATAKRRRYREGHRVSQTRVASLLRLVGVLTIIVSMFAYATPAFAGGGTVPGQTIGRFQDSGSDGGSGDPGDQGGTGGGAPAGDGTADGGTGGCARRRWNRRPAGTPVVAPAARPAATRPVAAPPAAIRPAVMPSAAPVAMVAPRPAELVPEAASPDRHQAAGQLPAERRQETR